MNYEMYTDAGNRLVEAGVRGLVERGLAGKFGRAQLPQEIEAMCKAVAKHHPEVYDTEPQYDIAREVNKRLCEPSMWLPIERWDW